MARDLATLQAQLDAAYQAQIDIASGGAARDVTDQNGERVVFSAGNSQALSRLILTLEYQIGQLTGAPLPLGPMRTLM